MDILTRTTPSSEEHEQQTGVRPLVLVTLALLTVARGQVLARLLPTSSGAAEREWALPRRVLGSRETLETAAQEELRQLTQQPACHLEQLCTQGNPEGQSGERVLEVAYLALCPPGPLPDAAAARGRWWTLAQLPALAPGHDAILRAARGRLRSQLQQTNAAWSLLPEEFSLSDLQSVYEAVEERQLDKRNFRKWVLANGLVEATQHERRDGAHRPARLYRFISRVLAPVE